MAGRIEWLTGDISIDRGMIPDLMDATFWEALDAWSTYKRLGSPYSGGWMEQPAHFVDIAKAFDGLLAKWQEEQRGK